MVNRPGVERFIFLSCLPYHRYPSWLWPRRNFLCLGSISSLGSSGARNTARYSAQSLYSIWRLPSGPADTEGQETPVRHLQSFSCCLSLGSSRSPMEFQLCSDQLPSFELLSMSVRDGQPLPWGCCEATSVKVGGEVLCTGVSCYGWRLRG